MLVLISDEANGGSPVTGIVWWHSDAYGWVQYPFLRETKRKTEAKFRGSDSEKDAPFWKQPTCSFLEKVQATKGQPSRNCSTWST